MGWGEARASPSRSVSMLRRLHRMAVADAWISSCCWASAQCCCGASLPAGARRLRSVVWIASYPKSGNTWLRFLICNLAFGPVESAAQLNQLAPDLHELREEPNFAGQRILLK